MASTSRRLQLQEQLLCIVLGVFLVSQSSVTAWRIDGTYTNINTGCEDFNVELSCVLPINDIDPNSWQYKLAFFNHFVNSDAYTLSIVWTSYPNDGTQQYQRNVWSANRNHLVATGAWFNFIPNGSLVLYDTNGSEMWSTQTDNMGAMGLDLNSTSGELILYGAQNQTIWSTFSHPTDTIVTGQQLEWPGMQLVSNGSSTNNSEGVYSLVMQPAGLVLYASLPDPQPYFVWNYFAQSAEAMPVSSLQRTCSNPVTLELSGNGQLALSIDSSLHSTPFNTQSQALCNLTPKYSTIQMNSYPDSSQATFMVLESDGNLRVYVYNPGEELTIDYDFFNTNQCDLPEICGGYSLCKANGLCDCPSNLSFLPTNSSSPTEGCSYSEGTLVTPCTASAEVQIGQVNAADYYSNSFSAPTSTNVSMSECKNLCVKNCSCTASFYNSESGACYSVSDYPLSSMRSTTNSNLTALVKISTAAKKRSLINLGVEIGIGISGFVVLSVVALGLVVFLSRRKARVARRRTEDEFLGTLPGLPPRYSRKDLDKATLGFIKTLGSGGFGTVYEGKLKDGSKIAVKKLDNSKNTKDFRAEMATLGSIHHVNLVRLRGFCADGVENMLVYEYMPNGSLDRWLFDSSSESTRLSSEYSLDWETRFKIALGTARGLAYLHEECEERIIHLDIKPQNILLDEDFNPKVADFGLSKLVDRQISTVVTTLRGTPGYLAPEWLLEAAITEKADVYSYGIVLFELVTGRKSLDISKQDSKERYVPAWLLRCILQGDTRLNVVDPRLNIKGNEQQVTTVINVALECIQIGMTSRPSMGQVVQMLEGFLLVPDLQIESLAQKYRFMCLYMSEDISVQSPFRSSSRSSELECFIGVMSKSDEHQTDDPTRVPTGRSYPLDRGRRNDIVADTLL